MSYIYWARCYIDRFLLNLDINTLSVYALKLEKYRGQDMRNRLLIEVQLQNKVNRSPTGPVFL